MESTVLSDVLEVFSEVGSWFADFAPNLYPLFWTSESGLTFLGVLAVAGLSVSVVFLVLGIIQRFLHFSG